LLTETASKSAFGKPSGSKKSSSKTYLNGAGSEVNFEQLARRSMIESLNAIVPESAAPITEPASQTTDGKSAGLNGRNASAPAQAHGSDDTGQALGMLLEAGIKFIETLSRTGRGDSLETPSHATPAPGNQPRLHGDAFDRVVRTVEEAISPLIKKESATDKAALHIPLPGSLTAQRIAHALTNALSGLMAR
jgi:hypothetical protein